MGLQRPSLSALFATQKSLLQSPQRADIKKKSAKTEKDICIL
jgi:hypothetical protein